MSAKLRVETRVMLPAPRVRIRKAVLARPAGSRRCARLVERDARQPVEMGSGHRPSSSDLDDSDSAGAMSGTESEGPVFETVEVEEGHEVLQVSRWRRVKRKVWGLVTWATTNEDGSRVPDEWVEFKDLGSFWQAQYKRQERKLPTQAGKRKTTAGAAAPADAARVVKRAHAAQIVARDKRMAERAARLAGDQTATAAIQVDNTRAEDKGDSERDRRDSERKRQFGAGSPSGAARVERQREEDEAARERAAKPALRRSLRLASGTSADVDPVRAALSWRVQSCAVSPISVALRFFAVYLQLQLQRSGSGSQKV
eukprot:2864340-Prymnesium_polylepis.2